jgi:hypothetical protein
MFREVVTASYLSGLAAPWLHDRSVGREDVGVVCREDQKLGSGEGGRLGGVGPAGER